MLLLPTCSDNTPFSLEPMKRVARSKRSNVSTLLHMSAHGGTHVCPRQFLDDRPGADARPLEMLIVRTPVVEVAC